MLRRSTVRSLTRAAAAMVLPLVVASCSATAHGVSGSGSAHHPVVTPTPASEPIPALQAAWKRVAAFDTAHVNGSLTLPGQSARFLDGVLGWGAHAGMSADLSGGPNFIFLDQSSGPNVLMSKTTTYLHIEDQFAEASYGGMHWLRTQVGAESSAPERTMWGDIEDLQQQLWPGASLNVLADHRGTLDLGTEHLDGVAVRHYRGRVTAQEVTAHVAASPSIRAALLHKLLASGRTTDTIDIWLDQSGRLYRDKETIPSSAGTTVIDRTYTMFGTPLQIQTPDANDTTDVAPTKSTS